MEINAPTHILTNSQSAMVVARNHVFHACTKHIEIHYHYVTKWIHAGDIDSVYVPTQGNVADLFTKPLPREKFEGFCKALGLLPCGGDDLSLPVCVYIIRSRGVCYNYVSLK
jgi:hypothetical protein